MPAFCEGLYYESQEHNKTISNPVTKYEMLLGNRFKKIIESFINQKTLEDNQICFGLLLMYDGY